MRKVRLVSTALISAFTVACLVGARSQSAVAAPNPQDRAAPRRVVVRPDRQGAPNHANRPQQLDSGFTEVDDLMEWNRDPLVICDFAPPYDAGSGFLLQGPEDGWNHSKSGDQTFEEHAYYTFAGPSWGGYETNNWVWWAPRLPNDGEWEVEAYIPRVATGRNDTSAAQYRIWNGTSMSAPRSIDQRQNGRWASLGTYRFTNTRETVQCGGGGPYVELRDVTPDGGQGTTVLVDAVRWVEPDSSPDPVSIRTYLRDIPEGGSVSPGQTVWVCFDPSRAAHVVGYWTNPSSGRRFWLEYDDGGGGHCFESKILEEPGRRLVEGQIYEGGRVLASDDTYFYVGASGPGSTPTNVPTVTPTPAPTANPANPPEAAQKQDLIKYLRRPGVIALGLRIPDWIMRLTPEYGYNEDRIDGWLGRFQSPGYTPEEIGSLRRAVIAEDAVKRYYDINLELVDTTAKATAGLITTFQALFVIIKTPRAISNPMLKRIWRDFTTKLGKTLLDSIAFVSGHLIDQHVKNANTAQAMKTGVKAIIAKMNKDNNDLATFVKEEVSRTVIDLPVMKIHVTASQSAVDDVAERAASGRLKGTEDAARSRVNAQVNSMAADADAAVELAENAMKLAEIYGMIADVSDALAQIGVPIAAMTSAITHGAEVVAGFGAMAAPMDVLRKRGKEIHSVVPMAFDPAAPGPLVDLTPSDQQRRLPRFVDRGIPLGVLPWSTTQSYPELDAFLAVLNDLSAAVNSQSSAAFSQAADRFIEADDLLTARLERDAVPAYLAAAATDWADAGIDSVVGEQTNANGAFLASRISFSLSVLQYIMDGPQSNPNRIKVSITDLRGKALAYRDAVLTARQATRGVSIPGSVAVVKVEQVPPHPRPGEAFEMAVTLQNIGGSTALDVEAELEAAIPLRLTGAQFSLSDVPTGGTKVIRFEAIADEAHLGQIMLTIRDRSADEHTFYLLVPVEKASGGTVHLPFLAQNHDLRRFDCPVAEQEPNNRRDEADLYAPLCSGWPLRGQMTPGDAYDAYLLRLEGPTVLEASLIPDAGSGDVDLYLFKEREVAFVAKSEQVGVAVETIRVALDPGRYYLAAFPAKGEAIAASYAISWREM